MSNEQPPFNTEEQFANDQAQFARRSARERLLMEADVRSLESAGTKAPGLLIPFPVQESGATLQRVVTLFSREYLLENARMMEHRQLSQDALVLWDAKKNL